MHVTFDSVLRVSFFCDVFAARVCQFPWAHVITASARSSMEYVVRIMFVVCVGVLFFEFCWTRVMFDSVVRVLFFWWGFTARVCPFSGFM